MEIKDNFIYQETRGDAIYGEIVDGITSIGKRAFSDFDRLKSVTIGSSVQIVGEDSFRNTALTDVYFTGSPPAMILNGSSEPPFYDEDYGAARIAFHVLERNWSKWEPNIYEYRWYPYPDLTTEKNPYNGYHITTYGEAYAWISCRDAETQKFLEGVNIQIYVNGETTLSGQTDRLGFCHVALENAGTYSLKASKAGYEDATLSLELTSSSEYPQSFLVDMVSTTVASGECGDNLTWKLGGNGLVKINGTGAMWDYAYDGKPWYPYRDQITSTVIEDGATSIGQFAFSHCSNLTSVTIPAGVTNIGSGAFTSCGALTDVAIPNSVSSIGSSAFSYCVNLSSIRIPSGVSRIEPFTFTFCSSLERVDIPRSVTSIGEGAFNSCFALTDVHYSGTQAQWNSIQIDRRNDALAEADIHTA